MFLEEMRRISDSRSLDEWKKVCPGLIYPTGLRERFRGHRAESFLRHRRELGLANDLAHEARGPRGVHRYRFGQQSLEVEVTYAERLEDLDEGVVFPARAGAMENIVEEQFLHQGRRHPVYLVARTVCHDCAEAANL